MPINHKTQSIISQWKPNETIFDGGPARSKILDHRSFEALEIRLGGTAAVRRLAQSQGTTFVTFMEADWVVTDLALYYVNYNALARYRWRWRDMEEISDAGSTTFGRMRRLGIRMPFEEVEILVPRRAALDLLSFAHGQLAS